MVKHKDVKNTKYFSTSVHQFRDNKHAIQILQRELEMISLNTVDK